MGVDGTTQHDGGRIGEDRQQRLNEEKGPFEVDRKGTVEASLVPSLDRPEITDTGIDEDGVELAEGLADALRDRLLVGYVSGIGPKQERVGTQRRLSRLDAFGSVPVTATRAPSWMKRRAVASPMPLVPPVISARLPLSLFMKTLLTNFAKALP